MTPCAAAAAVKASFTPQFGAQLDAPRAVFFSTFRLFLEFCDCEREHDFQLAVRVTSDAHNEQIFHFIDSKKIVQNFAPQKQ